MFRKVLFWSHLSAGIAASLVIVMLCITGVILTYEKQMLNWFDSKKFAAEVAPDSPMELDALVDLAQQQSSRPLSLVRVPREEHLPYSVDVVRTSTLINPYTGEPVQPHAASHHFFATVTSIHRWFNLNGDARHLGENIVAVSNAIFAFLLISGLYLWFPRVFNARAFRAVLLFRGGLNSRARDFNWHNVLGIWSLLPLVVVVGSGVFISYPSASAWFQNLVVPSEEEANEVESAAASALSADAPLDLQGLLAFAHQLDDRWNFVELPLPLDSDTARVVLDYGAGRSPQQEVTYLVDRHTGEVIDTYEYAERPLSQTIVAWIRYAHTGEAFGFVGQTIAGLVSITTLVMVWTGLALAYRRLIVPALKKRSARAA